MLRMWEGLVWRDVRVEGGIVGMVALVRVSSRRLAEGNRDR